MTKARRGKATTDGSLSPSQQPAAIDTIESLRDYIKCKFSKINDNLFEVTEKMATKDCIISLMDIIDAQKKTIEKMEDKIVIMESHITHIQKSNEAVEHNQRRLGLRINGID